MYGFLFEKVLFPLYDKIKRDGEKYQYFIGYCQNTSYSRDVIKQQQSLSLQALINHCYNNVPYYRKIMSDRSLMPSDIKTASDLAKLPVLTKSIIKSHYQDLIADNFKGRTQSKTTGGSTGEPLKFEIDHNITERRYAIMLRGYEWSGYKVGRDKALYLWGATLGKVSKKAQLKEWLHHRFYNRYMVSTFNLNKENIGEYIKKINKIKPDVIVAYTTPVYLISQYISKHRLKVHSPRVILTGAEPLYSYQKKEIGSAFNARVINTFGCRECMLMGSEHFQDGKMYVNDDHLILESVDDTGSSHWGQNGELAITDLHNYGMPLLRYKNGDLIKLQDYQVKNLLPFSTIDEISGRVLDQIQTVNGGIIPGELFPHLLKDFDAITSFQIIQHRLEEIEFNYVPSEQFDDRQLLSIKELIDDITHSSLRINFNKVDAIQLTSSGKHRVTINEIQQ